MQEQKNQARNVLEEKVKCDIITVLDLYIEKLKKKDLNSLRSMHDEIVHCASVFQDEYSVSIAVITYALLKILEHENNIDPAFISSLVIARNYLQRNNLKQFNHTLHKLSKQIAKKDKELNLYIRHVLNEAEIKKGSKIYDQGISLAQTAKLLNISQWELMKYIGKTTSADISPEKIDVKQRIVFARQLFQ